MPQLSRDLAQPCLPSSSNSRGLPRRTPPMSIFVATQHSQCSRMRSCRPTVTTSSTPNRPSSSPTSPPLGQFSRLLTRRRATSRVRKGCPTSRGARQAAASPIHYKSVLHRRCSSFRNRSSNRPKLSTRAALRCRIRYREPSAAIWVRASKPQT